MTQQRQLFGRQLVAVDVGRVLAVLYAHEVLLVDIGVSADQLLCDALVLRQHEQAGGIDVEAAGGRDRMQMIWREPDAGAVFAPLIHRIDQRDGGFVAVFRLSREIADRLV